MEGLLSVIKGASKVVVALGGAAALLLSYGFGTAIFNFVYHPSIVVGFAISAMKDGSTDTITISNNGTAAATGMTLTVSAPKSVGGKILYAPDPNTTIDNGPACGVNCFRVTVPTFSHGPSLLKISSLISHKSNITAGDYMADVTYSPGGVSEEFKQPLKPTVVTKTAPTPSPFSLESLTSLWVGVVVSAAGGVLAVVVKRRERIEITKVFPLQVTRGEPLSIFGKNFGNDRQDVWLGPHRIRSADINCLLGWSDGRIDIMIPDIPDPLQEDGYEIMIAKGGSSKTAPVRIKILQK